jgi:xanthine dehydrogenase accessory factor
MNRAVEPFLLQPEFEAMGSSTRSVPYVLPLREQAVRWLADARPAVLVTVAAARGSVPRAVGTRMLVGFDEVLGTIGGGHLEMVAIDEARARLVNGPASGMGKAIANPEKGGAVHERHLPLGPTLGQCCGGAVTLRFQPLSADALTAWPEAPLRFHLQLYGAGHVGRAIVRVLEGITDCRVQWIDERDKGFPREPSVPHIDRVCVDSVEAEVEVAPPNAYYLVMTHSHDLDLRISEAILRRGDFAFFGLIGSATKRARFIHRLEARGIGFEAIERMTCPVGLPGIDGKEPEVIAIAVAAQLLKLRKVKGLRL